jgi:hexosaminidase
LWTEYIQDIRKLEYLAFPRLSALAEVAWSPKAARSYDDFLRRLPTQFQRFDALGVNHYPDLPVKTGE